VSSSAVPIQPIAKGSMLKLWGGIAILAIAAGALAWAGTAKSVDGSCLGVSLDGPGKVETTSSGLKFKTVKAGNGGSPTDADVALINYKGTLKDGTQFDAGQSAAFPVTGVVPGFTEALKRMQRGGSYKFCIPSQMAYGDRAMGDGMIPANSPLVFDAELLDFRSQQEIQMMQQMMQQQQGAAPQPVQPGR
jgi:hypothetical protein